MAREATPALHYSEEELEAFLAADTAERYPVQATLAGQLLETIRAIKSMADLRERGLGMYRKTGLAYEDSTDPQQKLSFSLYTLLCDADDYLRSVLPGVEG